MRDPLKRYLCALSLALVVALVFTGGAFAAVTGNIQVEVTDEAGEPLPGATITISGPAQLGERALITNSAGVARFNAVQPGPYTIRVGFPGLATVVSENNVVELEKTTIVPLRLDKGLQETVTVVGTRPDVDVTTTTIGEALDVDYVEELPQLRTYQGNLLLVPGVDNGTGGNPVIHGGTSRDNLYLIDSINTTDPVTQTFGANINFDIIEEQQIQTGGIRAEHGGVVGGVSNLVTKSGGNVWSGTLNYFRSDPDFEDSLKHNDAGGNTTTAWQASYTLGGPILKDKLWHFTSWEANDTEIRTVLQDGSLSQPRTFESDYYFGKLTWQVDPNHRLNLQINGDPTDIPNSNATDTTITEDQLSTQEQGGKNLSLRYTGVLGTNLVLEAQATRVRTNLDAYPAFPNLEPNVSSLFGGFDEQFGRYVNEQYSDRDRDEYKADLSYFLQSGWGEHNLKFGVQYTESDFTSLNINSGGESFSDLPAAVAGAGFDNFGAFVQVFTGFADFVWVGLADNNPTWTCTIAGTPCDQAAPTADPTQWVMTVPGVGTFNANDLAFPSSVNSEAAAAGWLRFQRNSDSMLELGSNPVGADLMALYAQDEWRAGRWTTYVGVRVEEQKLRDTFGNTFFEFDRTISPRVGVTYDVLGDGKSKIFGHFGRLYDPVADGLTSFGNPAGQPVTASELWIEPVNDFFTYFFTGGPGGAAVVAPNLETPRTDEALLGYARTIGNNMSIEVTGIYRKTEDIIEDLEPILGALNGDPSLTELGFTDTNGDGSVTTDDLAAPFVIYNPPGAERKYRGVDVVLRKRFSDRWSALAGYTYSDFKGNMSEDSQFGIIGDDSYLDPRLDYNYGPLGDVFSGGGVGANDHLVRVNGYYAFPFGLTVGTTLTARSGFHYSLRSITTPDGNTGDSRTPTIWNGDPTRIVDTLGIDRGLFGGATDQQIVDMIPFDLRSGRGSYEGDWLYFWNLSFRYRFPIYRGLTGALFLDVFNVLDEQDVTVFDGDLAATATITPATIGDRDSYVFQTPLTRQAPRALQLGVRLTF